MFALSGALSSYPRLVWFRWIEIILAVTCFHFFAYITNDLIDLNLDKTSHLRANDPLVRGLINTRTALIFALIQYPLCILFCILIKITFQSMVALTGAFIFILAYNIWGKRISFPILTDIIQGLSWAFLYIFGASAFNVSNIRFFWIGSAFIITYIVMINGIHGSLRDIYSDYAYNINTTAISLGVKLRSVDSLVLSTKLKIYAGGLQIILMILPFVQVWNNREEYHSGQLYVLLPILVLLEFFTTVLAQQAIQKNKLSEMIAPGTIHAFLFLSIFFISILLFRVNWLTFCFVLFLFSAPALAGGWLINSFSSVISNDQE